MKQLNVTLAPHLLIRKEGNEFILFNRKNDAVIKISNELLHLLSSGQLPDTETSHRIIHLLSANKMLQADSLLNISVAGCPANHANIFALKSDYNPFNVLWAITARCNLHCIYCFPNIKAVSPSFLTLTIDELLSIAEQLVKAQVLQVTFTGGEAFLEKHLWLLAARLYSNNTKLVVITNGTTLTDEVITNLIRYEMLVAVSVDAIDESVNAITRGVGNLAKTIKTITDLVEHHIPIVLLITVQRYNFASLLDLIHFAALTLKIKHITLQDLRPFGTKDDYNSLRLTREQEQTLPEVIAKIKDAYPRVNFNLTELFIFPHKNYLVKRNGKIMQCPAGHNMAYIDFYGDVYPCTHLPSMKLGNLLHDGSLTELWQTSKAIRQLRQLKEQSIFNVKACSNCMLNTYCYGGCRGDAIFYNSDIYALASRCPKQQQIGVVE